MRMWFGRSSRTGARLCATACRGAIGSMLGEAWVGRVIASLPEEILKSRPEELYLEDFATIANIP